MERSLPPRRGYSAVLAARTVCILMLAGMAAEAAPPPRPITLEEALDRARGGSPSLVRAAGEVRTGRARVRSALGAFLPSLSLSASTTRQYPAGGGGTRIENGQIVTVPERPWSYGAGFSSGVTLFAGGSRFFDLRQARATLGAAEATEWSDRFALDLAVKSAYFDVLAARESDSAATAQFAQAEQQRRTAIAKLRAARATVSDSLRAEIQLRNAQLQILQARQDVAGAEASLSRAVASNEPVTASGEDPALFQVSQLDEEGLERQALEGPAVTAAKAGVDAARAALKSAWADYLPSLTASYSRSGGGSGADPLFGASDLGYNGSLRFALSLPVFDRFAREAQGVSARVALDNAEAALRDARLAARESMIRHLGTLRTAGERERVQITTVAAAEFDLRAQTRRYELGESTLLDVLTSQTQLDQARQALIRARYDRRLAVAQLEALTGLSLSSTSTEP